MGHLNLLLIVLAMNSISINQEISRVCRDNTKLEMQIFSYYVAMASTTWSLLFGQVQRTLH